MSLIPLWAKALIIAALLAAGAWAIHRLDVSRQEIGYQRAVGEYNVKLLAAQADARAQEAAWQDKQKTEQEKTNDAINKRDAAYAGAVSTIVGLRDTISNIGNGLSTITASACSARISALSTVSNECADALAEMARHAEGERIDKLSCLESWPK